MEEAAIKVTNKDGFNILIQDIVTVIQIVESF